MLLRIASTLLSNLLSRPIFCSVARCSISNFCFSSTVMRYESVLYGTRLSWSMVSRTCLYMAPPKSWVRLYSTFLRILFGNLTGSPLRSASV